MAEWQDLGPIRPTGLKRPRLDHIPQAPGVYRFLSDDGWCYIGQAKDLRYRIREYHSPTLDNEHEHRIHRLLRTHSCNLQILTGGQLSDGSERRWTEMAALAAARTAGLRLWNLSQNTAADRLRMRIAYHQTMLEELTGSLQKVLGERG